MPAWLPTLTAPLLLPLVTAAIAIPSLLLLYFLKLRRQERAVASTILWKKAVQDLQVNSPFQKLRRNLLLLLQMLVLMALILALTNPVIWSSVRAGENTVILIDRSASMRARDANGGKSTRLEEAKREAKDLVGTLARGSRAMVIAFDDSAETVAPFTGDVAALQNAIDAIQQTDRPTRLKLAYQLADAQMNFDPAQLRPDNQQQVFLYSDGKVADASELSLRGQLTFNPIGDAKSKNIAVVAFSAKRNYERPTQVQVFARLANYGPDVATPDVQLSVSPIDPKDPSKNDFKVEQVRSSIKLLPTRWTDQERQAAEQRGDRQADSVEFTLDLTTAAALKLEQTDKTGDVLGADDEAVVFVPPPKPLEVCLVTDGNYFLERAVRALNLQTPAQLLPAEWEKEQPTKYDVVFFDRYVPKYRPASGNFVWFGAIPKDLQIKQRTDDAGRQQFLQDVEVLDWKRDHPTLRYLSLARLYVAKALSLDVPLSADVLVEGRTGPLVVLSREGRSVHLVIGFDVLQSNWPLKPSFPAFINNATLFLAAGSDLSVRESLAPGSTPKIPRPNLDRAFDGSAASEIKLITPTGSKTVPIAAKGDFALPPLNDVGLYQTQPLIPQYERLAVNLLDDAESDILPAEKEPGSIGQTNDAVRRRSPVSLWWWLVAAVALPLLMVEWWVYTRRVHA